MTSRGRRAGAVLPGTVGGTCHGRDMDELLMLTGEDRHCADCATVTIFLPVEVAATAVAWVCTACDGAVVVPGLVELTAAA